MIMGKEVDMSYFRVFGAALLGATLLAALPSKAAITIVGSGLGRECFLAAELKRDPRTSIDICSRALMEDTQSRRDRAATLVNRGILRMQARELTLAIADYDDAIRLEPKLAEAYINRGIALLHRGGADREAIAALTKGLSMNPSRPEVALYSRAVANEMVGNVREAFEDYRAAAAAAPDWSAPAEELKRFNVERRETAKG
jgi:tetratricopeptide (TPR) repeat protein